MSITLREITAEDEASCLRYASTRALELSLVPDNDQRKILEVPV